MSRFFIHTSSTSFIHFHIHLFTQKFDYYSNQIFQIDVIWIVIHLIYDPFIWSSWKGFLAYTKSWIKPWTSVGINIIDGFFLWMPVNSFQETFTCKKLAIIFTGVFLEMILFVLSTGVYTSDFKSNVAANITWLTE